MVRVLRILSVLSIAFILFISILTFQKAISLIDWINYCKLSISGLIVSLIYLLLDNKRSVKMGKLAIVISLFGAFLCILSIPFNSINNLLQLPVGLFILSFICLIESKLNLQNVFTKLIFWSFLIVPISVFFTPNNTNFYTFLSLFSILPTSMVVYKSFVKKDI
jgi:hypothetical protein